MNDFVVILFCAIVCISGVSLTFRVEDIKLETVDSTTVGIETWSIQHSRGLMIVYKPLKKIADEVKVWRIENVKERAHFIINISKLSNYQATLYKNNTFFNEPISSG